jgi:hypothetical protein
MDKAGPGAKSLPAWRVILDMVRYRWWLWAGNWLAMMVLIAFWQVPGLLMREFFDLLTGDQEARLGVWAIAASLLACQLGRTLGILGLIKTNVPFFVHTMALMRKNLLKHILRRPGASALPDSPGEAISRFRGDVFEISLFALWLNDIQGGIAFVERYSRGDCLWRRIHGPDAEHQSPDRPAGRRAVHPGRDSLQRGDQAHRKVPPGQPQGNGRRHQLYRRVFWRRTGGQGGDGRRRGDRAF